MIASLVGYLQLAAFAVALFGRQLCSMFGLPHTPAWLGWVQENKFKVLFAAFIASNFASRLTSTGAFEVIVDGDTVFSKLEMGRLPTFEELRAGLDHLEFGGTLA